MRGIVNKISYVYKVKIEVFSLEEFNRLHPSYAGKANALCLVYRGDRVKIHLIDKHLTKEYLFHELGHAILKRNSFDYLNGTFEGDYYAQLFAGLVTQDDYCYADAAALRYLYLIKEHCKDIYKPLDTLITSKIDNKIKTLLMKHAVKCKKYIK